VLNKALFYSSLLVASAADVFSLPPPPSFYIPSLPAVHIYACATAAAAAAAVVIIISIIFILFFARSVFIGFIAA